jgi:hypothetical protein
MLRGRKKHEQYIKIKNNNRRVQETSKRKKSKAKQTTQKKLNKTAETQNAKQNVPKDNLACN